MARKLIDVAARAGVDVVKFQTFKAEEAISPQAPKAAYQMENTSGGESQLDMVKRLELPFEAFKDLAAYARQRGILFMSTPFDDQSIDFLADMGVPAFKVPSGEIVNLPFLVRIGSKGRPMIVSTGMATLGEVDIALRTIYAAGQHSVALLQCVSTYPAIPSDINLRAMQTMVAAFDVPVGYSDHTLGPEVSLAAVALGACILEKHFTLDRTLPGPDHPASLEPDELASLVRGIRVVEAALGHGRKVPAASEASTAAVARKSLVAACDIPAGALLTDGLIAVRRPGTGILPALKEYILGRRAKITIPAGTVIRLEMLL
jgi:N,N'-diacetyllegionaminate synthase